MLRSREFAKLESVGQPRSGAEASSAQKEHKIFCQNCSQESEKERKNEREKEKINIPPCMISARYSFIRIVISTLRPVSPQGRIRAVISGVAAAL